jgi:long-chain fatty acid transport protein
MTLRVERRSRPLLAAVLLLCGSLAADVVAGQEPIVPLQLSLSDPGARSMGFGGAFVALADDATAAFANPAGLVQLARPEVSVEGRQWSYSTPYTQRGRVEGEPSGTGADTVAGIRRAISEEDVTGLAFLSLAYPKGRWSFALFRHRLASFEFSSETRGLFAGGTDRMQVRFFDQQTAADLDFTSYGLSAAYRISDVFDVGFGVIYHDLLLASEATVFIPREDPVAGLLAPTDFLPERTYASQTQVAEDTDWGLIGGFLWRLSDSWRIGGVYRQGPEADFAIETRAGQAVDLGVPPGGLLRRLDGFAVELPWVLGLGWAYRAPDGRLTVSFQWDHIQYSTIVRSLERAAARLGGEVNLAVDDANELHLGGEYVFPHATPVVALRLGAWLDPDHQPRDTSNDPFLRVLQPPGEDQLHLALGLGVAFERFQIDVGVDFADELDTASISAVYSF